MVKITLTCCRFLTQNVVLVSRNVNNLAHQTSMLYPQLLSINTNINHLLPTEQKVKNSPVYSAMDVDVMEDAVEPLSQSLSVVRLELRLRPGNDSTDSPLFMERMNSNIRVLWRSQSEHIQLILKQINEMQARICTHPVGQWEGLTVEIPPLLSWHCLVQWWPQRPMTD